RQFGEFAELFQRHVSVAEVDGVALLVRQPHDIAQHARPGMGEVVVGPLQKLFRALADLRASRDGERFLYEPASALDLFGVGGGLVEIVLFDDRHWVAAHISLSSRKLSLASRKRGS